MRIFIFLLLCTFALNAQKNTIKKAQLNTIHTSFCKVEIGPPHTKDAKEFIGGISTYTDKGFYLTKYQGLFRRSGKIEFYGKDLKYKNVFSEDLTKVVSYYNDNAYYMGYEYNKKKKMSYYYKQKLNPQTLKPVEDIVILDEAPYDKKDYFGSLIYTLESNKAKLFCTYKKVNESNQKNPTLKVKGFNQDFELQWEKQIKLPYNKDLYKKELTGLSSSGTFYFLGKLYHDKTKDKVKGEVNYTYSLYLYNPVSESNSTITIDLDDYFINGIEVKFNNDENLVFTGFYSKKGVTSFDGCFYKVINPETGEILVESIQEFSVDFLKEDVSNIEANSIDRKEARGKDTEMDNYHIINTYFDEDGGVTFIAEQQQVTTSNSYSPSQSVRNSGTVTNTYYTFKDIIIIHLNNEGKIEWTQKIDKFQRTKNDGGQNSSFKAIKVNGNIYFIYNDNPGFAKRPDGARAEKSLILITEIDKDGNKDTETLFTMKDVGILTVPAFSEKVASNAMILYNFSRNKYSFARLTF